MPVTIRTMRDVLRALEVLPAELPEFDTDSAPDDPVALFVTWLADAMEHKISGPHAMTLSTADRRGRVSSRVLLCKDVDESGRWYFASDAASMKGRELAENPHAAASFYWLVARSVSAARRPPREARRAPRTSLPGR